MFQIIDSVIQRIKDTTLTTEQTKEFSDIVKEWLELQQYRRRLYESSGEAKLAYKLLEQRHELRVISYISDLNEQKEEQYDRQFENIEIPSETLRFDERKTTNQET